MQKKRKILICDTEKDYSRRLQEYMNENCSGMFETSLFTTKKSLVEYLKENEADVLLTSIKGDIENSNSIKGYIYLSSEKPVELTRNIIYKYSPAKSIVAAVVEIISDITEESKENSYLESKMDIVGVYTPIKRCFQTTFCITLGQILSKEKKTLYLNFEGFSGFDLMSGKTYKADLMDALYFAECNNSSFGLRVDSISEKIGDLRYISPTKAFTNLSNISPSQWNRLLDAIATKTDYEVLIMDLSEQVNGLLDILDRCDKIYTIIDNERMAQAKIAQYQMLLREKNYLNVISKTESIYIPRFKEIPADFEMLPYSELTNYVKRIINEENKEHEQFV